MVNGQITSFFSLAPWALSVGIHIYMSLFLSVWSSAHRAPYLRTCTPCDHNFWYTYVKWWYLPVFCSFRFCFSGCWGGGWAVKRQTKVQNEKKNYTCHTSYLRNSITYGHDFWYTCVKWRYGQTKKTAC